MLDSPVKTVDEQTYIIYAADEVSINKLFQVP